MWKYCNNKFTSEKKINSYFLSLLKNVLFTSIKNINARFEFRQKYKIIIYLLLIILNYIIFYLFYFMKIH